jgi:2-dehydropantoate 2-reductase
VQEGSDSDPFLHESRRAESASGQAVGMRFIIYGAGAVGGAIGGRLAQQGYDVTLIARGPHHDAIFHGGLRVEDPDTAVTLPMPVVDHPSKIAFEPDDVVILSMKTQDTADALDALAVAANPGDISVVCAQNGVENERLALRRFENVYAMCVMLPATHLEPGSVQINSSPMTGILDLGRYPAGVDDRAAEIAAALSQSTFVSEPQPSIMRWKHTKLIMNLGNSIEAACGQIGRDSELFQLARAEGKAVLNAAGIDFASDEEDRQRRGDILRMRPIDGKRRMGGSSWQSLARGTGSIETDYLNGEIALIGRQHGIPTPVNSTLQSVARRLVQEKAGPASMTEEEMRALIQDATAKAPSTTH